jgi:threonine/homoserine/homoserine lactone efflux protein
VLPIWSFLAVTIPLILTPGASTAVVLRNTLSGGVRAGIHTAAGVNGGSVAYGLVTAFGLAFALQRWPSGWTVLRVAGAAFMVWLGGRSLAAALRRDHDRAAVLLPASPPPRSSRRHVAEGFLTNVLNPAIASFYLIVLPQFAPRQVPFVRSVLLLTAIHVSLAFTWHLAWAVAGGTMAPVLARGWPRRIVDAAAGVAMLALALQMAVGRG